MSLSEVSDQIEDVFLFEPSLMVHVATNALDWREIREVTKLSKGRGIGPTRPVKELSIRDVTKLAFTEGKVLISHDCLHNASPEGYITLGAIAGFQP